MGRVRNAYRILAGKSPVQKNLDNTDIKGRIIYNTVH
jgi:hypothetical protein